MWTPVAPLPAHCGLTTRNQARRGLLAVSSAGALAAVSGTQANRAYGASLASDAATAALAGVDSASATRLASNLATSTCAMVNLACGARRAGLRATPTTRWQRTSAVEGAILMAAAIRAPQGTVTRVHASGGATSIAVDVASGT